MKRKLVKQGASTLMISLPSKWLKENSLTKGSEIELLTFDEDTLIINAYENKQKTKEAHIEIATSVESSIRTIITNAYRLGYDKLFVKYNAPDDLQTIKKVISKYLIGFEITETKEGSCIIENITEPSAERANKVILKVLFGISELLIAVQEMLDGKENFESIEELEEKIQQYENLVRRTHSKNPSNHIPLQWIFHNQLTHAQREIFFMAKYISQSKKKIKIGKDTKTLFSDLIKVYSMLKEGYMGKDIKLLEGIHEIEKQMIYENSYRVLRKSLGEETILNHRIASAIRGFYLCSSPLLGIFMLDDNSGLS